MTPKSMKTLLGLSTALALTAGGAMAQDIQVGHLTHHTGEYGGFGVANLSLGAVTVVGPTWSVYVLVW